MDRVKLRLGTTSLLFLGVVAPLIAISALNLLFPNWYLVSEPLHSLAEGLGAFIALALACLLLMIWRIENKRTYYFWASCAFISIGVLDGLHASLALGNTSVWLHSSATFLGGLLFSLVWLPESFSSTCIDKRTPRIVGAGVLFFGLWSIIIPNWQPVMVRAGIFTPAAVILNVMGGLFFLVAACYFITLCRTTQNLPECCLATICLLFGAAGLLFKFSVIWDSQWWLWHLFRLTVYSMALGFVYVSHRKIEEELHQSKFYLEDLVALRTADLTAANEQLQQEIFERNQAEESLKKAHRALEALSHCNKALVHSQEESELLEKVCKAIVEKGGYRMVWVGYAEEGVAKKVRPVAQAGFENGYLDKTDITWADTERGRGPTGTAIRTGEPRIAQDIPNNPKFEPWSSEATKRGYASSMALPLLNGNRVFGALNVYSADPDTFTPEEVELLKELSADLSYGITAIRTRAERERAEGELRQAHETLQMAYDKLERIKAYASTSDKLASVGRLTAGVSHEILNPLNGIILNLHYLIQDPETPTNITDDLKDMLTQANRIAKISQDLLAFARQRPPERHLIQLNEVVMQTLCLLDHELRLSNIEVDLRLADSLPLVDADKDQFQQAVFNLLSNAQDAMPKGGKLVIETTPAKPLFSDEGTIVELRVQDTGPGINPKHMDKIFDPFFTTKPEGQGTGLGLSICQGIIENHGGSIWAQNAPGGGAAFVVRLVAEEEV